MSGRLRALGWRARRLPGLLGRRLRPTTDPVERAFRRHGQWVTRYRIGEGVYGGEADLVDDGRIARFLDTFPDCRTVLELGSLEGAHSFSLARHVERVTAIEGRRANIEKAQLVQGLLGVENVVFREADLDAADIDVEGRFDGLFCVGLLYHLQRPWLLLDRFAAWSDRVFLQTHFAAAAEETLGGVPGLTYGEYGKRDPLSGLSESSFWMTLPALVERLERNGYRVRELDRTMAHPHGPIVTLAAERTQVAQRGRAARAR